MSNPEINRFGIIENPGEEVTLVDSLTKIALRRVEVGEKQGMRKLVYLNDPKDKVVYKLVMEAAGEEKFRRDGLFLFGISAQTEIPYEERDFWFNLPNSASLVDDMLAKQVLSGSNLQSVQAVAESLDRAETISRKSFEEAYANHILRQKRDADKMRDENSSSNGHTFAAQS